MKLRLFLVCNDKIISVATVGTLGPKKVQIGFDMPSRPPWCVHSGTSCFLRKQLEGGY